MTVSGDLPEDEFPPIDLDIIDLACPHCGEYVEVEHSPLISKHPNPHHSDVGFCPSCSEPFWYTKSELKPITVKDLDLMRKDQRFAQMEITARVDIARTKSGDSDATVDIVLPHVEHDGREPHEHHITALPVGLDGELLGELPEGLKEIFPNLPERVGRMMRSLYVELMTKEIKEWITPEVAHHVLWVYGDERASMPSATVSALIRLIQLAEQMDEEMLFALNEVKQFHGYVLAVHQLQPNTAVGEAGVRDGMAILRLIADLRTAEDLAYEEAKTAAAK